MKKFNFKVNLLYALSAFVLVAGIYSCSNTGDKTNSITYPVTDTTINGWKPGTIGEMEMPQFAYSPKGGPGDEGSFHISMNKVGLMGYWSKTFEVKGDQYYSFTAFKNTNNVKDSVRSAFVTIRWEDAEGNSVLIDSSVHLLASNTFKGGKVPNWARKARMEFPVDQPEEVNGWTKVSGIYKTPPKTKRAVVRLYLIWAPEGSVQWSDIQLEDTTKPPPNIVRVATVQYGPATIEEMPETQVGAVALFEPMIKEASDKKANIILLPEFITHKFSSLSYREAAEPIPGSSTKYLGELAKKYHIDIIAGLLESDSGQIFNTSVLVGSDGRLIGKYRKVSLPSEEYLAYGTSPGHKYPVFNTKFGKIGIMTCWDSQYPEVAQKLSENGAQIIFTPTGGGNPKLLSASAIINQVYIVVSTFAERPNWIKSGIYNYQGDLIVKGTKRGQVLVTELDLNKPKYWAHLGDLKSMYERQRPD